VRKSNYAGAPAAQVLARSLLPRPLHDSCGTRLITPVSQQATGSTFGTVLTLFVATVFNLNLAKLACVRTLRELIFNLTSYSFLLRLL